VTPFWERRLLSLSALSSVLALAIGNDARLGASVHGDEKVLARLVGSPHKIVVDTLDQTVQILATQVAFDDQDAMYHARPEMQIHPTERLFAFAQQVGLGLCRAAHAIVSQIGKLRL
jgi:hypothetical protein